MAFLAPLFAGGGAAAGAGGAAAAGATTAGLTTAQMVGIGLTAASTAASISANEESSRFQSIIAKNNAAYREHQARDAERRGVAEEDAQRIQIRRLLGTQKARYGASGVQLGSGSPEDVLIDTLELGEQDITAIRNNAAREAFGYRTEGWGEKMKGRAARRGARSQSFETLLTGATDSYGIARSRKY